MDPLHDRVDALESQLHTVHQQTRAMARRLRWWRGLAASLMVLAMLTWALPTGTAQEEASKGLEQRVAALEDLLKHFSREGNEVFITGANLHIVNGLGRTDCGTEEAPIPDCPNGLGNLIVGYNEPREEEENIRTGSHNVAVGQRHNFSTFGGLVVGDRNEISGPFASVSGGTGNIAGGLSASISGGSDNRANAFASSVSGGANNTVDSNGSSGNSISGGVFNTIEESTFFSSISGGSGNTVAAGGVSASISGGVSNRAGGQFTSISGGRENTASSVGAEEGGGSVSGGRNNHVGGIATSVSGGIGISVETEGGWAAGSFGEESSGRFRSP